MTNISEHINKYFADRLTPENAALLLVDHQTGLSLGVETMNPETFRVPDRGSVNPPPLGGG